MIADDLLSVQKVAERLAVSGDVVLSMIHSGRLDAVNVARPGRSRPRWRVEPEALERFIHERRTGPRQPTARPRKAKQEAVIEFF